MTSTAIEVAPATIIQPMGGEAFTFHYDYADMWLDWIRDRQETTQQGYNVCVKCFIEWLQDNGITQPTREDVMNYRKWLETPHPDRRSGEGSGKIITFSADTRARYFRVCKMLFKWLYTYGYYYDVAANIRSPKTNSDTFMRDALQSDEVREILESIDRSTEKGKRDYALILLAVTGAHRIIELQRADIGDIEKVGGKYRFWYQGKGHESKDKKKNMAPEVVEAIEDYLDARGCHTANAPLFAAVESNAKPGGGRLTEPSVSRIIKKAMVAAGYDSKRKTAHSLRHTGVTLDRKAGASTEEARLFAGHSSIVMTQRYDHALEQEEARDAERVYSYIFNQEQVVDFSQRAAELMSRIPASKKEQAIAMLEALAE